MKVFFDATVWCGAILRPAGLNAHLLDLASVGGPLRGVTSDVVLLEFYRHAVEGTLGRVFDPDDARDYIAVHEPLLEIEQAPIGRSLPERTDLHNLPLIRCLLCPDTGVAYVVKPDTTPSAGIERFLLHTYCV